MLSASNASVPDALAAFKSLNIQVAFLVPTVTGLEKSIMDAHKSVRDYLRDKKIHDYATQLQGTDDKKTIPTTIVSGNEVKETSTSLYRPETKSGDPRIWIYGLKDLCEPSDLIAICVNENKLVAINVSRSRIDRETFKQSPPLLALLKEDAVARTETATELLNMLADVGRQGWVKTMRRGDTGIGFTLETLLGIPANSNAAPDYKGIEIKSHRLGRGAGSQVAAFSKVPDWSKSRLKGSKDILRERGYFSEKKQRQQVFHEISTTKPNSIGLQLSLDAEQEILRQFYVPSENPTSIVNDVQWAMEVLQESMRKKHRETMWVSAETTGKGVDEAFRYISAVHTTGYDPLALPTLLDAGAMTVHYTITERPNGSAKDQGYLFKVSPKYLPSIFSYNKTYSLA